MQRQRRPPAKTLAMVVSQLELIKRRELTPDEVEQICLTLLRGGYFGDPWSGTTADEVLEEFRLQSEWDRISPDL